MYTLPNCLVHWCSAVCRPSPVPLLPCERDPTSIPTTTSNSSYIYNSTTSNNIDLVISSANQSNASQPESNTGADNHASKPPGLGASDEQPPPPQPVPAKCLATAMDNEDGDLSGQILVQFVDPGDEGAGSVSENASPPEADGAGPTQKIPR